MSDDRVDDSNLLVAVRWLPVHEYCTRCGPDPEGYHQSPAAILVTSHPTERESRLSVAAQVCSLCAEDEKLPAWVEETDPWDEFSHDLMMMCDDEPRLIRIQRIEPRCTRCRMQIVQHIGLIELPQTGTISSAPLAHMCHACRQAFETGAKEGPRDH